MSVCLCLYFPIDNSLNKSRIQIWHNYRILYCIPCIGKIHQQVGVIHRPTHGPVCCPSSLIVLPMNGNRLHLYRGILGRVNITGNQCSLLVCHLCYNFGILSVPAAGLGHMNGCLSRIHIQPGSDLNIFYIELGITFRHNKAIRTAINIIHPCPSAILIHKNRSLNTSWNIGICNHLVAAVPCIFRRSRHSYHRTRHNCRRVVLVDRPVIGIAGSGNCRQLRHICIKGSVVVFRINPGYGN